MVSKPTAIMLSAGLLGSVSAILSVVQMTSSFSDSLATVQDLPQAEGPVVFNFTAQIPQATLDAMLAAAKAEAASSSSSSAAASSSSSSSSDSSSSSSSDSSSSDNSSSNSSGGQQGGRLVRALRNLGVSDAQESVVKALQLSAGRYQAKKRALADAGAGAGSSSGASSGSSGAGAGAASSSSSSSDAGASSSSGSSAGSGVSTASSGSSDSSGSSSSSSSSLVTVSIGGERYTAIGVNGIASRFNMTITVGDEETMDKSKSQDFKYIRYGAKPGLDEEEKDEDGNAVDNGEGCPLPEDILTADELKALEDASSDPKKRGGGC